MQLFVFALLAIVSGCETVPVQEMSDARQAIMAAKHAGAEEYANGELMAAEVSLRNAEGYLNSAEYSDARREAIEAKSQALEALRVSEMASGEEN